MGLVWKVWSAHRVQAHPMGAMVAGGGNRGRAEAQGSERRIRMRTVVLALCSALLAPYQCATKDYRPLDDTAPKSLWMMAERFEKEGQTSARETTLKQLIEQYPGSRYASRARAELGIPDPEEVPDSVMVAAQQPDAGAEVEAGDLGEGVTAQVADAGR